MRVRAAGAIKIKISLHRTPAPRRTSDGGLLALSPGTTTTGRYTAAVQPDHNLAAELVIEWPTTLPAGWNDDTRIAADDPAGVVAALTLQPDGGLHADLLPNPGGEPHYAWGDEGPGSRALYQALIRCATGNWQHPLTSSTWMSHLTEHPNSSALYQAITTQHGQLLLQWADIRRQADDDLATLQCPT